MTRISKTICIGVIAVTLALAVLLSVSFAVFLNIFGGSNRFAYDDPTLIQNISILLLVLTIASAVLFLLAHVVVTFLVIWRMWSSIQDGHARTTPGKAIGFLFIPFFNVYWIFQVWAGFPTDYNKYLERYRLDVPRLTPGLYVFYPILILLSAIPFLGFLAAAIGIFVFFAIISRTSDAVNALVSAVQQKQNEFAVSGR